MERQNRLPWECIILAAGESKRMGRPKQLLDFNGEPLVGATLHNALEACEKVILVQGPVNLSFLSEQYSRVELVTNYNYRAGQLGSLQRGLELSKSEYAFIMLADLPLVSPDVYRQVAEAIGDAPAAYPIFGECRGHPVLIGPEAKAILLQAPPRDRAMRVIAPLHPLELSLGDPSVCRDADTLDDLKRLREQAR